MFDLQATREAVRAQAQIPAIAQILGLVLEVKAAQVRVRFGTQELWLPFVGQVQPMPSDVVQVEMRAGRYVCSGLAVQKPTTGTVSTVGSTTLGVTVPGVRDPLTLRWNMSAYPSPKVGDLVQIVWSAEGGSVAGKWSTTPAVQEAPAAPVASVQAFHPAPFRAVESSTYTRAKVWDASWFTVVSTYQNCGAWWGSQVADTIPDSARITYAAIYLSTRQVSYSNPQIVVLDGGSPNGWSELTAAYTLPAREGWVPIPTSFIDVMKTKPSGIGFKQSPDGTYDIYNRPSDDGLSFALDLAWEA